MRGSTLSVLIIVVGILCLALAVFYFIPGPYHPFTFSGTPTGRHTTHAIAFLALAVVAFIASRFVRSSTSA
jgi:hypothetical protein